MCAFPGDLGCWGDFRLLLQLLQGATDRETLELCMIFYNVLKTVKVYVHICLYTNKISGRIHRKVKTLAASGWANERLKDSMGRRPCHHLNCEP